MFLNAPFIIVPKALHPLPLRFTEHTFDGVDTFVKNLDWRAEGDAHEMVTGGVEEISAVRWIDVEENTGNDNRLFLKQFLEERLCEQRNGFSCKRLVMIR